MSRTAHWEVHVGYGGGPAKFDSEKKARQFYDRHKAVPSYINPSKLTPAILSKVVTTTTIVEKNR